MQMPTPPPDEADWTAALPQTDHVRFFRRTDWAATSLGPLASWDATLRIMATLVLADSKAACLWWGPIANLTAIYNEHYAPLAGGKHPALMGQTFQEGYPDLWPDISAFYEQAQSTGRGVNYSSAQSLIVERRGWREETFFSGNFVPVGLPAVGYINSTYEVTAQKLSERRTSMMNTLAAVPSQTVAAVCAHILATLETNAHDVPLAMLYTLADQAGSNALQLQGHIGLPPGHQLIVDSATIDSDQGLVPDMRRAGSDTLIIDYDDRFDSASWKGWGEPSKKVAIVPILSASNLFGYLIFGTNPYRPFDDICQQLIRDMGRMVSSIVSSAFEIEANKKRQEQLEADLAFSDLKLRHLIDHASVGMCHVSLDGYMLWANDHYYELAGRSASDHSKRLALLDVYLDEDRPKVDQLWADLLQGVDQIAAEVRLKRMYTPPIGDAEPAQLQLLAFPYRDEFGSVRSVMACTTDISRLKWAQTFQARLAAEAREAKRQQEAFIDVVSHEMRNPLSAIVHCADAITSGVEECLAQLQLATIPEPCLDALHDNLQSAKIILQCANHQKRIIDDILTLSKLDSRLLSITPVAVEPTKLTDSILSIFEAELKNNEISYNINPDTSLSKLRIDYLYFDPSRVTQVFINLLTNAIKFVKPSKNPVISIRFGVCLSAPRTFFPDNMFWATKRNQDVDVTSNPEWGTGEEVYLTFSVTDSGIGLKHKEIHKIFERFRQANVKTHVRYGGSGLGLFISKDLTEKQGGEIGVSSVLGEGSTFGFYVKARRVEKPSKVLDERQSADQTTHKPKQLHVLLVEDNIINQQVLGKQLKKAGCHVDVANHGLEALNILEKQLFDIVLMDLEMPILDGLGAMRRIRQKEESGDGLLGQALGSKSSPAARLPIIAVTANVRKEQIDTAIAAGADRVMRKPFKAADLVSMMESLLPQTAPTNIEPPTPEMGTRSGSLIP
ncbi:putative histidine kinase HHK15p [Pyrenochaeta sp. DS3sAY3a]|nr:putative histidine kinase HHK15p [Pyrenochaeta sp. DS3sAY3a]